MGFNFSGMMRGLGSGLVASGQIMQENNKLNWQTEQTRLQYERDQNMERLRNQNENTRQKNQQDFVVGREDIAAKTRADEFAITSGFEKDKIRLQGESNATDAAYKQGMLGVSQSEAQLKKEEMALKKETDSPEGKVRSLEKSIEAIRGSKTLTQLQKDTMSNALTGVSDKVTKLPDGVLPKAMEMAQKEVELERADETMADYVKAKAKTSGYSEAEIWQGRVESKMEGFIETAARAGGYHVEGQAKATPGPSQQIAPENIPKAAAIFQGLSAADKKASLAKMADDGWDKKTIDAISLTPEKIKNKYGLDLGELLGGMVKLGVAGVTKVKEGVGASANAFETSGGMLRDIANTPSARPQDYVQKR